MSDTTALTIPPEKLAEIDTIAADCRVALATRGQKLSAGFEVADLITRLEAAITDDMMQQVMKLQGHALGFRTDKDGKLNSKGEPDSYPIGVVRTVFIEATVRGFWTTNNEFNIIAGRFYGCKAGFDRLVKTFPGLTNFQESMAVPEMTGSVGLVAYVANWLLEGEPMEYQRSLKTLPGGQPFDDRIAVRVNSGMGHDAVLGKAHRKAYAGIYSLLTGHDLLAPEGDAGDSIDVESRPNKARQSSLFSDQPANPPAVETNEVNEGAVAAYDVDLQACTAKSEVGAIAKRAGSDTSLSTATRANIMVFCATRRKEVPA